MGVTTSTSFSIAKNFTNDAGFGVTGTPRPPSTVPRPRPSAARPPRPSITFHAEQLHRPDHQQRRDGQQHDDLHGRKRHDRHRQHAHRRPSGSVARTSGMSWAGCAEIFRPVLRSAASSRSARARTTCRCPSLPRRSAPRGHLAVDMTAEDHRRSLGSPAPTSSPTKSVNRCWTLTKEGTRHFSEHTTRLSTTSRRQRRQLPPWSRDYIVQRYLSGTWNNTTLTTPDPSTTQTSIAGPNPAIKRLRHRPVPPSRPSNARTSSFTAASCLTEKCITTCACVDFARSCLGKIHVPPEERDIFKKHRT